MESSRAEERAFKDGLRARLRRATRPLYLVFFVLAVFLGSVQALLYYGYRPAVFWVPMGVYALTAGALLARGRWGLALWCILGAGMLATTFPKAAALKARGASSAAHSNG